MGSSPRQNFKKKVLATSIAALASVSYSAFAQDAAPVEEVLVTGMRASLEQAMDIKRDSTGVVDAISAEDIGKMPDANLAESLQRIAGVSISRTNGEGAQVTVRGIDPSLNMVTLNGRNMPSVNNNGTAGDKGTRAYDFANLASESVNGVEVYKTGRAQNSGGGLGAAINLKTLRPLDVGAKTSVGAKVVQDSTVYRGEGAEYTPEVSGLYSWVNDDDNFGVSLTASYQERDNVRSNAFVNNWQLKKVGAATVAKDNNGTVDNSEDDFDKVDGDGNKIYATKDGTIPFGATVSNMPAVGGLYALPTDLRYALEDNHRERTNAQLTMQYRPVDNVTATLDYTYSENDLSADRAQQSTWYGIDKITAMQFDTGNAVATPLIYRETYDSAGGKDVSFAQQQFGSVSQNNSLGLNLAWDVTDALTLQFDYHNSTAKNNTHQYELGLNANVVVTEYSNWSTDLPVMGVTINDAVKGNNNGVIDGGDVSGAMGTFAEDSQLAEIEQYRLIGDLNVGEFAFFNDSKVSFGLDARTDFNKGIVNKGEATRITMGNWGGVAPASFGSDWANNFTARDFAEGFDQSDATGNAEFLRNGLNGDFNAIKDALEDAYARAQTAIKIIGDDPTTIDDPATTDKVENVEKYYWVSALNAGSTTPWLHREHNLNPDNFNNFPGGKVKASGHVDVNRAIEEEVTGIYAAFTGGFDLAGLEANLGFGLRYENTDVTSAAVTSVPSNLNWDKGKGNDWSTVAGVGTQSVIETSSYDNVLPNLDFDLAVTDDVKLRASYSKTMARAGFGQLKADKTIDNIYQRTASAGNSSLIAMESDNFDLSAEWYYTDDSYVSAAYFRKDVANFVGNEVVKSEVYGLRDARLGARAVAAGLGLDEETLRNTVCGGSDVATCVADSTDPLLMWNLSQPVNSKDAAIDGLELSVQHWFGTSGFGMQANYTMVDSDLEFDDTSTASQFALIGLSDTANLVGFYDANGVQLRLAYNWRDEFLSSNTQGGNNAPGYTEAFAQLDFSASYDISDSVTISLEGMNITGEDYRVHGRSDAQMFSFEDLGARYTAGVRVNF